MVELKVGKIQPYKLKKLAKRINQRLNPRYYRPYEVVARVREVFYKLKLPEGSKVHLVFHISLPKPMISTQVKVQPFPHV